MKIVYGFPTNRISLGKSRLAELQQYVDAFYLYADEVPSVSDPNIAVSLDPLFSSETVPREDAIEYNTGEFLILENLFFVYTVGRIPIRFQKFFINFRTKKYFLNMEYGSIFN